MTIAFGGVATTEIDAGSTSFTASVPAAPANSFLFACLNFGIVVTGLTGMEAWTQFSWSPLTDGTNNVSYYYYKISNGSESNLNLSWSGSAKAIFTVAYWDNVDTTTPFVGSNGVTSLTGPNLTTPVVNNTDATFWAVATFMSRSSTSARKNNSFTPPAALVERSDANNSLSPSAPWVSLELCDSNSAVTAGNHSYTATAVFTESHCATTLFYLKPAITGTTYTETPAESVGVTDSVSVASKFARPKTEQISIHDAVALTKGLGIDQNFVDITDSLVKTLHRTLPADSISITDAVAVVKASKQTLINQVGFIDSLKFGHGKGFSEQIGITDSLAIRRTVTLVESISVLDNAHISIPVGHNPREAIGITDTVDVTVFTGTHYLSSQSIVDYARQQAQTVLALTDAEAQELTINDLGHIYWAIKSELTPAEIRSIYDHFRSARKFGKHWVTDME